jgi:hypothetical protein
MVVLRRGQWETLGERLSPNSWSALEQCESEVLFGVSLYPGIDIGVTIASLAEGKRTKWDSEKYGTAEFLYGTQILRKSVKIAVIGSGFGRFWRGGSRTMYEVSRIISLGGWVVFWLPRDCARTSRYQLKASRHFDILQLGKDYSSRLLLLKSALDLPASTIFRNRSASPQSSNQPSKQIYKP